ncbi:hypothetical protein VI34_00095 [Methylophilales bacterium MBRSG12]|uniref:AI-2E family transporter n=1 Tax=Methylophilales bacterium MBRS-H7 TaxID=1623450 RepID=A0A0H4J9N6_9PROT|nr:hypothetical protein UZ34_03025 [Methylophilales bacterium MBRSF5]AKO65217.1 hypothetical protein VI33_00095 [Methylophilales bacterium MBRS-H7]AKO66536.1 hypothetical protein VI34_00095 [Methylophilales bacterium MBRSG12]
MKKIITEIKNSQTTWRKSFYAALVIAVVLFFFTDRFMAEFWIAMLAAFNFLILLNIPKITFFVDESRKEGKYFTIIFLVMMFMVNYFGLVFISEIS